MLLLLLRERPGPWYAPHFCFSNYLTSSLDREGAPGGPAGFTYRQGRGRLPLLHSRGVWGERATGKGLPANGASFAEVISLESRGGIKVSVCRVYRACSTVGHTWCGSRGFFPLFWGVFPSPEYTCILLVFRCILLYS